VKVRVIGVLVTGLVLAGSSWSSASAADPVFYGCVKGGKLIPGSLQVGSASTCKGGAELVSWNQGTKTISGIVDAAGNGLVGKGYSATRISTGTYEITFPPGTRESFPVVTVSPFGLPGAFPVAEVSFSLGFVDGSAQIGIILSSTAGPFTPLDGAFQFIAVASLP